MVSATPRNTPQNNTQTTTHRPTDNGFCNTKKHSTKQYQHNNTQANRQWFLQHQETLHKTIPTQHHTGQTTMVSATLRNTSQNNTHSTTHRRTNNGFCNTKKHFTNKYPHNNTQAKQQWFLQHQKTLHKIIPTQQHTGEPTMVSATLRNTSQTNTHTTTHRPNNNGFCNTKKHFTRQYPHNNTQAKQQWFLQH